MFIPYNGRHERQTPACRWLPLDGIVKEMAGTPMATVEIDRVGGV